jgi:hypothetical protein
MKCSNCENEEFTCVCGALVSADAPWREVVVDHRPGETCHVATSVDPATGWPRPLLDRGAVFKIVEYLGDRMAPEAYVLSTTEAIMQLARPMPTREQIASVLLYEEGSEWAENTNRHYELADAVLALLNGAVE